MTRHQLAAAELALMEELWSEDGLTARELLDRLYPDSDRPQHGTVQRLLQRLEDKGFIERDRSLPVQRFSARIDKADYACDALESLAERLSDGSITPLITHLVEAKRISRSDLVRLRRLLEEQ